MPFIADDLFINFVDKRAAAGVRVLGELAKKTQVLFFTHHEHLLEVAQKALGAPISGVTLPVAASPPPSAIRMLSGSRSRKDYSVWNTWAGWSLSGVFEARSAHSAGRFHKQARASRSQAQKPCSDGVSRRS